jgi:mRNA-degrading endonuclease RelE of RelBE toxin-antitoxin system
MKFVFFETPLFSRLLPSYLDEIEYGRLQGALIRDPERGDLMPGTGGFRKLRWADARRGKGRRGGLRVIYYVLSADEQIWLFTIYDKGEIKDLTASQCRSLKRAIHDELSTRRGNA